MLFVILTSDIREGKGRKSNHMYTRTHTHTHTRTHTLLLLLVVLLANYIHMYDIVCKFVQ